MRDRILAWVREALAGRTVVEHPGAFPGVPAGEPDRNAASEFEDRFTGAGGEVVRLASRDEAGEWLRAFAEGFDGVAVGALVPPELRPELPVAPPDQAALGVSMARGAAAFTGSLLLDAADGRRSQLLPPTHLIWLREGTIHATLEDLLAPHRGGSDSSALALHSGPSKSADIGQIMVRGVHGPGRVVAAILRW